MTKYFLTIAVMLLLVTCGDDKKDENCDVPNAVVIKFPDGFTLKAINAERINYCGAEGDEACGVQGITVDGYYFWLGRDGDYNNGAFDHIGSYDASHCNMRLSYWPVATGNDCEVNDYCTTFYALSGSWEISSVDSQFAGSFNFGAVVNCHGDEDEAPSDKCDSVPGTVSGCFNVY